MPLETAEPGHQESQADECQDVEQALADQVDRA